MFASFTQNKTLNAALAVAACDVIDEELREQLNFVPTEEMSVSTFREIYCSFYDEPVSPATVKKGKDLYCNSCEAFRLIVALARTGEYRHYRSRIVHEVENVHNGRELLRHLRNLRVGTRILNARSFQAAQHLVVNELMLDQLESLDQDYWHGNINLLAGFCNLMCDQRVIEWFEAVQVDVDEMVAELAV